ncbi:MAG: plasmid mobilization relaxosome protein MobC [Chitinophagaceae bacterium]
MEQNEKLLSKNQKRAADDTKNKGGRPKVAIKKNQVISVKCNSFEKKVIKAKAKTAGFTASEYLRQLGLEQKIGPTEKAIPKEILKHLSRVHHTSSNLNQIARRLNMDDEMTSWLREQINYHLQELMEIEEKIKSFFQ